MKISRPFFGIIYAIMGVLFTSLAINSVTETIWNFTTILLIIVATFDFIVAYRYLTYHKRNGANNA